MRGILTLSKSSNGVIKREIENSKFINPLIYDNTLVFFMVLGL
jgi:hypothetical protein